MPFLLIQHHNVRQRSQGVSLFRSVSKEWSVLGRCDEDTNVFTLLYKPCEIAIHFLWTFCLYVMLYCVGGMRVNTVIRECGECFAHTVVHLSEHLYNSLHAKQCSFNWGTATFPLHTHTHTHTQTLHDNKKKLKTNKGQEDGNTKRKKRDADDITWEEVLINSK